MGKGKAGSSWAKGNCGAEQKERQRAPLHIDRSDISGTADHDYNSCRRGGVWEGLQELMAKKTVLKAMGVKKSLL